MKYFYLENRYKLPKDDPKGYKTAKSGHCIYAKNKEDALQIAEEMGVSYPRFSEYVTERIIREVRENSSLVKRRQKGLGGIVWKREEL